MCQCDCVSAFQSLHFNKMIIIIIIILTSLKTIPRMAHILLYLRGDGDTSVGDLSHLSSVFSVYDVAAAWKCFTFPQPALRVVPHVVRIYFGMWINPTALTGYFVCHISSVNTLHTEILTRSFNMRSDHFLFPLELTVVFHLFSPHPLNLFWSISCLLHTSVPSLTLPFTFTPLFLITPLSFCSLIAVMYRLPGFFSSSSPNRIVQQGLCRSLWGEWQCRGPAVPQVENPHWKLDVKVSLLAMRLSQRKPLFVQSML